MVGVLECWTIGLVDGWRGGWLPPNSHNGVVNLPSDKSDWEILREEKYKGYDPVQKWKEIVGGGPKADEKLKGKWWKLQENHRLFS
jgi:hypothetical protein